VEPPVETPSTEPVVEAVSLAVLFTDLNKTVHDLTSQLSLVKSQLKQVEKHVAREMRVLDKFNARKNKNKGNRAPSGFVKPTKISDELAAFLGKEPGTLMARTDVTKQITAYIRSNSLQDKANGRLILADEKLKKLLNYDEKAITDPAQHLSYFNLQRYLSGHFEKTVA
jgi:chromatin remodeling complex protein RSC6